MANGRLKWYNESKGFGFIAPDDGGKDIFLHASEVKKNPALGDLEEGAQLSFTVETAPRGPKAVDVARVA